MSGCSGPRRWRGPPSPSRAGRPLRVLLLGLGLAASATAWADPFADGRRHYEAGLEAAQRGDLEAALAEFQLSAQINPSWGAHKNAGVMLERLGRLAEARAAYAQSLALAPTDKLAGIQARIDALDARLAAPPVVASGPAAADGPACAEGAVDGRALARLEALSAELTALSAALREGQPAPTAGEAGGGAPPTDPRPVDPAAGADGLEEAYQRLVYTASRTAQSPLDSPSTIAVLTAEDIRLSGATNVPDLLRRVAGVDVMQLSPGQPDLAVRGFNRELSNKVLVLLDGRSIYQDMLATPFWGTLPISLRDIERVEVIRGPASAVYGANAVTGVVNIITRTPGTGRSEAFVEAGRPGYLNLGAAVTGRSGANAYRFSAGGQQTGRWAKAAALPADSSLSSAVEDQDTALDVVRAYGRIDRQLGDEALLGVSGGYAEGFQEFYAIGALGDFALPFRSGFGRIDASVGDLHVWTFYNGFSGAASPWLQPTGGRDLSTEVKTQTWDVEADARRSLDTGPVEHQLSFGAGYRFKSVEWGYLEGGGEAPITEHHAKVFINDQATVGPVSVVGSLRLDRHPLVPLRETLSPRGAVITRLAPKTSARLGAGTAFRAPSQMESYLDLNQPVGTDGLYVETRGDRDLGPERILTVEGGVHDETFRWMQADLAAYWSRVTDLIYLQDIELSLSPFDPAAAGFQAGTTRFGNLDPIYRALGLEGDLHLFPLDGLDLYANGTLQRMTEEVGGQTAVDWETPGWKANLGASWRSPYRVDLSGHLHLRGDQVWKLRDYDAVTGELLTEEADVDPPTILVTRAGLRLLPEDALELAISAWNVGALLSGEGTREHPKGQPVGGWLMGSASYRF
ncbi:MAG: TonB-dependent receptor [Deltaproteobacteria bacterium]|nr:TonB-dependent receptor [Deltaproteobacteria bacterium]